MSSPRKAWLSASPSVAPRALRLFASLALILSVGTPAYGAFDMKSYYEQNKQQTKEVFIKNFPYDDYLKATEFTDFKTLQQDRFYLYSKFGDGDDFLYYVGENFIKAYPVQSPAAELNKKVDIGEAYLKPKKGLNRNVDEIYRNIGYFILGKVALKIEDEIKANRFDLNDPANAALVKRLEANKVYISVEESTAGKIAAHIRQRDWAYLFRRLWLKINDHAEAVYKFSWIGLISSVVLAISLFYFKWRKTGILCVLAGLMAAGLLVALKVKPAPSSNPVVVAARSDYSLQSDKKFFPIGAKGYALEVFKILDKNNSEVGQAIWLQRPELKATYFAYENVPKRYHAYCAANKVVLATTGGFTNNFSQPEGLTVENGNIVNAVLMHDRHGLVMISNGGIHVLNLKNDTSNLPPGDQTIENPLRSLIAYSKLLQWCRVNRATVFQTQLVSFSNALTIDRAKARLQLRERRLLALASDPQTRSVHHVIFNVPNQQNLADISGEIFAMLAARGKKVEAVLNLDVGAYDILNIFDENGALLPDVKGPVDIDKATNLIVYSR
jgi:hypothetical protein